MLEPFRAARLELEEQWKGGTTDEVALRRHSKAVDQYIIDSLLADDGRKYAGDIALVALGGYGREEMFPYSDIDLMILYGRQAKKHIGVIADSILYPLWDTALEIGHGVRTVKESIRHAEEEYFFRVALLDARLIYGSEKLFGELQTQFAKKFVQGHREEFVTLMREHRQARRERFGSHAYLLEPHLKEGQGGMRDIQAMLWTARVVFGLRGLDDIQNGGLLLSDEREEFEAAKDFLVRLRGYLHVAGGRKSDQLYFELQVEASSVFGHKDGGGIRGVEHFMREVYRALQTINITTSLFFDHIEEVLGLGQDRKIPKDKVVEKGIEIRSGRIHLTATRSQLVARPQLLLRVFLAMARTGLPLHHRSRKSISGSLDLFTDKLRHSPRFSKTFFGILQEADDVGAVLAPMLETGILAACIPEFNRIVALAQHDLYHIYTVDRHTLQAVKELHVLLDSRGDISRHIRNSKIVYLAAILHDIGKGSGKDHSEVGAEWAEEIGHRFSLTEKECSGLSFLVRYHLFIPENALRRDLNDTVFIKRCAEIIGSVERLAMLYLLSVADSMATGPSAWSDWKSALMEEMYLKIYPYLEFGGHGIRDVMAHEEQGVEWLRERIASLLNGHKEIRIDPDTLATDYILSFTPETIVGHILTQRDHYSRIRQRSLVVAREGEESWTVLVMTVDRPGLLAKICGVLALNDLAVSKAQIFTWPDGTVVDVIDLRPRDGLSFGDKDWAGLNEQLDRTIEHRMGISHRLHKKLAATCGRKGKIMGSVASKVVVDNKISEDFSVIEVHAPDIPGQLYHITQSMADFGINIHKAYIATEVEQLIDAFYVNDSEGRKLEDKDFQKEVVDGLLHSIRKPIDR